MTLRCVREFYEARTSSWLTGLGNDVNRTVHSGFGMVGGGCNRSPPHALDRSDQLDDARSADGIAEPAFIRNDWNMLESTCDPACLSSIQADGAVCGRVDMVNLLRGKTASLNESLQRVFG